MLPGRRRSIEALSLNVSCDVGLEMTGQAAPELFVLRSHVRIELVREFQVETYRLDQFDDVDEVFHSVYSAGHARSELELDEARQVQVLDAVDLNGSGSRIRECDGLCLAVSGVLTRYEEFDADRCRDVP